MFCDRCGASVPNDQRYCGRCGKDLVAMVPVYQSAGRVEQHIRFLGILWLALSALNAVGGVVLMILANTIFARGRFGFPPSPGPGFLHPLFTFIALLVFLKAACGFAAGWGLLNRESWARVLTIVLSFLALFNIPFGTALGVYGLWVLLPAESEREYKQVVRNTALA